MLMQHLRDGLVLLLQQQPFLQLVVSRLLCESFLPNKGVELYRLAKSVKCKKGYL
jgi:hypothetical protein